MSSVKALTLQGSSIPENLRQIPDAPKKLYTKGLPLEDLLKIPFVAIVGSRKVDSYGIHATKLLAKGLAEMGIGIISGLAMGVDVLAHTACLEAGSPTIAVLPSGIGTVYPKAHTGLAKRIIGQGTLVSEHDGDYLPYPHDFLIRNRLISGLAKAVIVTQAAARSGSLNTARHAIEQGRTVMAVPGPITNPLCEGPNNLLKMGAVPVTNVDDVLKVLGLDFAQKSTKDYELLATNEHELAIIRLMSDGNTDGEIIAQHSGLGAQEFNVHLTMLEIRGVISPLGANHWTLN